MKFHEAVTEGTPPRDIYARAARAEEDGDPERARYLEKLADVRLADEARRG